MTQSALALLVVAAAVIYLAVRGWRSLAAARRQRAEPGCGSACGCGDGARSGERRAVSDG